MGIFNALQLRFGYSGGSLMMTLCGDDITLRKLSKADAQRDYFICLGAISFIDRFLSEIDKLSSDVDGNPTPTLIPSAIAFRHIACGT